MSVKVAPGIEPFLYREVVSARNGQHLFTVNLCDLHGSEMELRGGRFAHFAPDQQSLVVSLERRFASGEAMRFWVREVLDWIGDQADRAWSFDVDVHAVDRFTFHWSFSHKTTAVVFALVWT